MKRVGEFTQTTVDIIRHGHCQGGEIYRGSTDVLLSDQGREQMHNALAPHIDGNQGPWSQIISSPLKRCRIIAEEWGEQWQTPVTVEPDFREMSFGDWDGQLIEQVHRDYHQQVKQFYLDPSSYTPPNGEAVAAVKQRVLAAWERVMAKHQGEHILLVQHGVSIRVLVLSLIGVPLSQITSLELPYAGRVRLKVYTGEQGHRVVLAGLNNLT